jgi:hypothetical protein
MQYRRPPHEQARSFIILLSIAASQSARLSASLMMRHQIRASLSHRQSSTH